MLDEVSGDPRCAWSLGPAAPLTIFRLSKPAQSICIVPPRVAAMGTNRRTPVEGPGKNVLLRGTSADSHGARRWSACSWGAGDGWPCPGRPECGGSRHWGAAHIARLGAKKRITDANLSGWASFRPASVTQRQRTGEVETPPCRPWSTPGHHAV